MGFCEKSIFHEFETRLGFSNEEIGGVDSSHLKSPPHSGQNRMTTITDVAHHLKSETSKSASGKSISRMFAGWPLMKLLSKRGIAT